MTTHRKLWWLLGTSLFAAFFLLGFWGREVYRQAPPIPRRVVTADGVTVFTRRRHPDRPTGLASTGGQQLGSIWGHGAIGARLVGRLAASRSGRAARSSRRAKNAAPPMRAARSSGNRRAARRAREEMRTNTLRAAVRRAHDLGRSGSRDRARRRALFRPFRRRSARRAAAARRLRHASQCVIADRGTPRQAERVLLLDRLGIAPRAGRTNRHLHEQLAARAARSATARRRHVLWTYFDLRPPWRHRRAGVVLARVRRDATASRRRSSARQTAREPATVTPSMRASRTTSP